MSSKGLHARLPLAVYALAISSAACSYATVPAWAQSSLLSPSPVASTPASAPPAPTITLPAAPAVPPAAASMPPVPAPTASAAPEPATPAPIAQTPAAKAPSTTPDQPPAAAAQTTPAAGASPATAGPVPAVATKPKKRVAPPAPPRETALSTDPNPTLTAETFFATAKASERYAAIADAGGWPVIAGPLSPGARGKSVSTLRLRLAIEGDLGKGDVDPNKTTASLFDADWGPDLTAAVKRFQARHGLKDTGVVAGATLKALNVPARVRFTELASSAQRLAGRQFNFAERYVVVNIPSASVEAIENGRVARRFVAVVGDPDHASPEVDAKVVAVNLNPTWTVPTSIIKNEIIPKMQKDPGYLSRAKIRILDGSGNVVNASSIDWTSQRATNYILRQDSGAANSLGNIRINMPNKFAVYMHDTPSKRFFGGDYRFLSHGCVRVQGVYDLASWLLEGSGGAPDGTWDKSAIESQIATGVHQDIRLTKPVPVAWVYLTGWADQGGKVQFRDDVYGIDTVGSAAQAEADPDPIGTIAAKP